MKEKFLIYMFVPLRESMRNKNLKETYLIFYDRNLESK